MTVTVLVAVALSTGIGIASDTGRVTYVTSSSAYLDRGSADGLAAGQSLELLRKKRQRPVGTCTITSVAAHHAVCASDRAGRAETGDRFQFVRVSASDARTDGTGTAAAAGPSRARPARASVVDEQRALVVATPIPRVRVARVRATATPSWIARGEIVLQHRAWATLNAANAANDPGAANFQKPTLDAGVRANLDVLPILRGAAQGLQLGAALRLAGDALAPSAPRYRPDEAIELTVWEAGAFVDAPRSPWVAALGRFRPRRAPGAPLVDGALVGGRALEGALEVGGYAGALPDAVTLAPRFDRFAGGIYLAIDAPLAADVVLLPRARIGLASTSDFAQSRAELETQAQLCIGDILVVGGGARVGLDGRTLLPSLDAAHVSVDNRPLEGVSLRAGYRFIGASGFDLDRLSAAAPAPPPPPADLRAIPSAHHGDASATWRAGEWISLGVMAGVSVMDDAAIVAADPGAGLEATTRGWVGPQLVFPGALLGGDLAVTHMEELGVLAGRSSYLQSTHWLGDVQVLTRISYFETAAVQEQIREGAAMLGLDVPLFTWLRAHGRAQSVFALAPFDGHARATPISLVATGGLSSSF